MIKIVYGPKKSINQYFGKLFERSCSKHLAFRWVYAIYVIFADKIAGVQEIEGRKRGDFELC